MIDTISSKQRVEECEDVRRVKLELVQSGVVVMVLSHGFAI